MDIQGKTVLVLGGGGLVGMAVCRELILERPTKLIVSSLFEAESVKAVELLKKEKDAEGIEFVAEGGNIFVRESLKNFNRQELLENDENRQFLITDVLSELTQDILEQSLLFRIIKRNKPQIIIDCINTATALAYQDVFTASVEVRRYIQEVKGGANPDKLIREAEKLITTQYVPQLIRHVQIMYQSMIQNQTQAYAKIGTSGTGGMGLNIPYTHSEEKPSRVLLSKSSVAGAHTMLLFLMARTPNTPIIKEIKPTAAIAWKGVNFDVIKKHGKPVMLYDCPPEEGYKLHNLFELKPDDKKWKPLVKDGQQEVLKSVFIDTGENGFFSRAEFEAITGLRQMEFVTPEEIARDVVFELKGGNTGHDVINALDNAVMGPTYRAGYMRPKALELMIKLEKQHNVDSVAFEMLGPPRLSKLLYECYLLKRCYQTRPEVVKQTPEKVSADITHLIKTDAELRSKIISIGIPILMPDGVTLLRSEVIKIPPYRGSNTFELNPEKIDKLAHDGWVDLREANGELWLKRFKGLSEYIDSLPAEETSSRFAFDGEYWGEDIHIGKTVSWLFVVEEKGDRMKD